MKSMSWILYDDDFIPHECLSCGFITRSPSIYRRHTRHCPEVCSQAANKTTVTASALPSNMSSTLSLQNGSSEANHEQKDSCGPASECGGAIISDNNGSAVMDCDEAVLSSVSKADTFCVSVVDSLATDATTTTTESSFLSNANIVPEKSDSSVLKQLSSCYTNTSSPSNCELPSTDCDELTDSGMVNSESGQKPASIYSCSKCTFSTSVKAKRRFHMRTEHAVEHCIYRCDTCSYQSVEHRNLLRHMERHILEAPHKCSLCSYSSTSQSAVRKHMSINHSDVVIAQSANSLAFSQLNSQTDVSEPSQLADTSSSCLDEPAFTAAADSSHAITPTFQKKTAKPTLEMHKILSFKMKECQEMPVNDPDYSSLSNISFEDEEVNDKPLKALEEQLDEGVSVKISSSDGITTVSSLVIEVKLLDDTTEQWTCLVCGAVYKERAKVRRHVKTKHRISMSKCMLIDHRDPVYKESSEQEHRVSQSDAGFVQDCQTKDDSVANVSTCSETADDIRLVNSICSPAAKISKTADLNDSLCTLAPDSAKLLHRQPVKLLTLLKPDLIRPNSPLRTGKSVAFSSSPSKLKKVIVSSQVLRQHADAVKALSMNQKKTATTAALSPVNDLSNCMMSSSNLSSTMSSASPSKMQPSDSEASGNKFSSASTTSVTVMRRPHFSQLVRSIKNDKSSSPVKFRRTLSLDLENQDDSSVSPVVQVESDDSSSRGKLCDKESDESSVLSVQKCSSDVSNSESLVAGFVADDLNKSLSAVKALNDIPKQEQSDESGQEVKIPSQMLKCAHCSYRSPRLSVLRRHLLSHVAERRYACSKCSREYKHEWTLTLHLRHAHREHSVAGSSDSVDAASVPSDSLNLNRKRAPHKRLSEYMPKVKKVRKICTCDQSKISQNGNDAIEQQVVNSNVPEQCDSPVKESSALRELLLKDMNDRNNDIKSKLSENKLDLSSTDGKGNGKMNAGKRICKCCGNYIPNRPIRPRNSSTLQMSQRVYHCPVDGCQYGSNWCCDMKKHLRKYHEVFVREHSNVRLRDLIRKKSDGIGKSAVPGSLKIRLKKIGSYRGVARFQHANYSEGSDEKSTSMTNNLISRPNTNKVDDAEHQNEDISQEERNPVRGRNRRKVPPSERYRPYKCSMCGKRSNWRWDITKHIRIMHSGITDAHVIVLNADVARSTLPDLFHNGNVRHRIRRINLKAGNSKGETEKRHSADYDENITDSKDNSAEKSLGLVDMLGLKRFKCSGCPHRSNHRGDVRRHIKTIHGYGICQIEVLSIEVASATLKLYRSSRSCRKSHLNTAKKFSQFFPGSVNQHRQSKDSAKSISTSADFNQTASDAGPVAINADADAKVIFNRQSSETSTSKAVQSGGRRRFTESFIVEYENDLAKCCDICPFRTDRTGLLALHKLRHRAPVVHATKTTQLLFTCPHCPYFVHTARQLERHVVLHDNHHEAIVTTTLPVAKQRYICHQCPFISCVRNDFWIHRRMHLGPPSDDTAVQCDSCKFWTSDKHIMSEHATLHTMSYYPRLVLSSASAAQSVDCYYTWSVNNEQLSSAPTDSVEKLVTLPALVHSCNDGTPLTSADENEPASQTADIVLESCCSQYLSAVKSTVRGPAAYSPCNCALQCPFCFYTIASVRLLRQHVVFHVGVCDVSVTSLFGSRYDSLDDGLVMSDMDGIAECADCRQRSIENSVAQLMPFNVDDKRDYFATFGLCFLASKD